MTASRKRWIPIALIGVVLVLVIILQPWTGRPVTFEELLLRNSEAVDRIEVVKGVDTIRFQKPSGRWMMAGEVLNQQAVDNLLIAASRLSRRSIVPMEDVRAPEDPVQFLFFQGKKVQGAFYLIKEDREYYIFDGAGEMAFGIELMGFENLSLEKIFSTNRDHYRVHLMIDLLPDEIRRIRVQPLTGTGFEAVQDSLKEIRVYGDGNRQPEVVSERPVVSSEQTPGVEPAGMQDLTDKVDEAKIRHLFSYFNAIRYERSLDRVAPDAAPSAIVEVEDLAGNRWMLEIFPWFPEAAEDPDMFLAMVRFNRQEKMLLVNYFYLDLLIRGAEQYFTTQQVKN